MEKTLYKMVWPTAILKRVCGDFKLKKQLYENVREDGNLGNLTNAQEEYYRLTCISFLPVRKYSIVRISLVQECTVQEDENVYQQFFGVLRSPQERATQQHTLRFVQNDA